MAARLLIQYEDAVLQVQIPIVEIRRSYDSLISTMGFPILVRRYRYIESGILYCGWYLHGIRNGIGCDTTFDIEIDVIWRLPLDQISLN